MKENSLYVYICVVIGQNQALVVSCHLPQIQFQVRNLIGKFIFFTQFDIFSANYSERGYLVYFENETNLGLND